jgi:hypothetical protein
VQRRYLHTEQRPFIIVDESKLLRHRAEDSGIPNAILIMSIGAFQNGILLAISPFRLIHAMCGWQSSTTRVLLKHGQTAEFQFIQ